MWIDYLGADLPVLSDFILVDDYALLSGCFPTDIGCALDPNIVWLNLSKGYDYESVLAHELGHLLGFDHEIGPPIMLLETWHGPSTRFCSVENYC